MSSFFVTLKINPSSVISFVKNINGNNPGRTEKKNNLIPEIVPEVYFWGFEIIINIMAKINKVKMQSKNVEFLKIL